jgi:gliding motility-associated-like protein
MFNLLRKVLYITLFSLLSLATYSQSTGIPLPPQFESVSINPSTGQVTIQWKLSPSKNVKGYIIFENLDVGNYSIDTVFDPTATAFSFSYSKVLGQAVRFVLATLDSAGNRSLRTDPAHKTIYTTLKYDSCNAQISVSWTKYQGWGSNLSRYRLVQYQNGTPVNIATGLSASDSTYLVTNVSGGPNYCYYLVAERNDGVLVTSNMSCHQTFPDGLPANILANQAVFLSNNQVELQFTLDPNAPSKAYQLTSSDSKNGNFIPIKQFKNLQGNQLITIDTLKSLSPRYYRLEALNSCGIGVKASNEATAMVPISSLGTNEITLVWNAYQNWPQGIQEYVIYRSIGSDGFQLLQTQSGTKTDYNDNISGLIGQQLSGNICYYVEAVSNLSSTSNTYRSRSATICVDITANVFIPDAFTPNGDGKNDDFKPSFAFLPGAYKIMIFNRSGFNVFESSDPMKGWDGKISNGEKAPEGVYVYFITFTSGAGKTVEKKGNFSLIYP